MDGMTGRTVGAKVWGRQNETVASCETGYCKTEFSMAHVADLHELQEDVSQLRNLLQPFCRENDVLLLGYGIHPVTPPGKQLLMKKGRAGVWDKIFPSNRHIAPEDGDDVHLFTINAASHVHVGVTPREAIPAVNVLNGFSAAQIALMANSSVWKGQHDEEHRCVCEQFWDLWMADENRVNDQQPPEELLSVPALTLGLVSALDESARQIASYNWDTLRRARVAAYCHGLSEDAAGPLDLRELAGTMLDLATLGLERRGLGEEHYLAPLKQRLENCICPADEMCQYYFESGVPGIVDRCRL